MKYTVTVDQALARGRKLCVFLPGVLLFSFMLGSPFVYAFTKNAWFLISGIVLGFLLSWFSWAFFVVRWRIWAYSNVRNIQELKKRAVEDRIMWPDDSFFNRTEIKSTEQQYMLMQLEARFKERDVFNDDVAVPPETYVYISRGQMYFNGALGAFFMGLSAFFYTGHESLKEKLGLYIMPVIGLYLLLIAIKGLRNVKPVIVLSVEGIRLQGKGLREWHEIYDERVAKKSKEDVLQYGHDAGGESVELENLAINASKLKHLLRVYRGRFEEKHNPQL